MSILVPTDFSDNATAALHTAVYLAKQRQTSVHVVHCLEWGADAAEDDLFDDVRPEDYVDQVGDELESYVDETLSASERPEELECEVFVGRAEAEIVDAVEAEAHEMVVIGATGQGRVETFLLGSLPEAVVRRSPVPVLVVPPEIEAGGYRDVVAPVDLTSCSRASLDQAVRMAREHDAQLTIVHAVPHAAQMSAAPVPPSAPLQSSADLQERGENRVERFLGDVDFEGLDPEIRIETGSAKKAIQTTVDDLDADLVVMGTHGRQGAERLFLGSTATKILRTMPCSVMTVRHREEDDE